jgi:flagellar biosynthesis/type III secretory pathway chaperone
VTRVRPVLGELNAWLVRALDAHEALIALSGQKRGAIIKGDTERIADIVSRELRELAGMNNAERARLALLPALSAELGVAEGATLGTMAEAAEPGESRELRRLQKDLLGAAARLRDLNAANRRLIESQLEYTEVMLNLLMSPSEPVTAMYGEDGRELGGGAAALFDSRI